MQEAHRITWCPYLAQDMQQAEMKEMGNLNTGELRNADQCKAVELCRALSVRVPCRAVTVRDAHCRAAVSRLCCPGGVEGW